MDDELLTHSIGELHVRSIYGYPDSILGTHTDNVDDDASVRANVGIGVSD